MTLLVYLVASLLFGLLLAAFVDFVMSVRAARRALDILRRANDELRQLNDEIEADRIERARRDWS